MSLTDVAEVTDIKPCLFTNETYMYICLAFTCTRRFVPAFNALTDLGIVMWEMYVQLESLYTGEIVATDVAEKYGITLCEASPKNLNLHE